jgi:lactoylglutathione lyase
MARGTVRIGVARRPVGGSAGRRPPVGVEVVLEVDDVAGERDQVVAAGWRLDEELQDRPWGLTDFRLVDPVGYYLRITNRHQTIALNALPGQGRPTGIPAVA